MTALRTSFMRASRAATRTNINVRPFASSFARQISTSSELKKREIISEKEIPNSSYTADGKGTLSGSGAAQHSTISVRPDPTINVPAEADEVKVVPLSRAVYDKMTPMMQKMTVMDKVVVVTG